MDLNDLFGQMPNRPAHPDMMRMSNVLLRLDSGLDPSRMDSDQLEAQFKLRMEEVGVDPDVLAYCATQRAYRALGVENPVHLFRPDVMERSVMLAGVWLDAFAAGVLFERNKAESS